MALGEGEGDSGDLPAMGTWSEKDQFFGISHQKISKIALHPFVLVGFSGIPLIMAHQPPVGPPESAHLDSLPARRVFISRNSDLTTKSAVGRSNCSCVIEFRHQNMQVF